MSAYTASPATADEGQTKTYSFSVTDPGADTYAVSSGKPDCGTGGSLVGGSYAISGNSGTQTGSFQCSFPDGPADPHVTISFTDSDTDTGNTADQAVHVSNVAPTVTFSLANDQSVNEGTTHTYNYTITDPGQDTVQSVSTSCDSPNGNKVTLSDTNNDTSGSFQCSFPDGPATADLTASATDSDGDTGNTAHQSVTVNNVAPHVTLSGAQNVDEGTTHTYTFTVSDPGQDTFSLSSGYPTCGNGGSVVPLSYTITGNSGSQTGSFDCYFPDGPTSTNVAIKFVDSDNASTSDSEQVVVVQVANVAPSVAYTSSPDTANEGQDKTYSFTVNDPGATDTYAAASGTPDCGSAGTLVPSSYSISGNSGTKTGSFQCHFPDGPADTHVTIAFTDSNGDTGNTADQAVHVSNVAPSVSYTASPATADEGQTKTYSFSVTDPGADNYGVSTGKPDCGTGGSLVGGSYAISGNSGTQTGSFQCSFPDGPADTHVTISFTDSDTDTGNTADQAVHVSNVAPSVSYTASPATADEGQTKTYSFSVTDPGADTYAVSTGKPDCGTGGSLVGGSYAISGNSGTQTGSFQCNFPDGPADPHVTISFTDSDTDTGNTADQAVHVSNVAPTVTFSLANDQSVNEGTTHTYNYTITDPGQDTVQSVSTSCDSPHGAKIAGSDSNTNTSGSFQCSFPDGPRLGHLSASATDSDGATGAADHQTVTVNDVTPRSRSPLARRPSTSLRRPAGHTPSRLAIRVPTRSRSTAAIRTAASTARTSRAP